MEYPQLIKLLSDGAYHSGEDLGKCLGVSRAAVWKQLKNLDHFGLKVESVKGKGYRLAGGINLLDADQIVGGLSPEAQKQLSHFEVLGQVDSTNAFCNRLLESDPTKTIGAVVLAEQQLSGKGRRGRQWISPFGENIYLTLSWQFESGVKAVHGLSLVVGLAVAAAIQDQGVGDIQLKWPNDILCQGKKMGGILIELVGDPYGACQIVIGIGVNVNMAQDNQKSIDQPWNSMAKILGNSIDRNLLASQLINHTLDVLVDYESRGFAAYMSKWNQRDCLKNKKVRVHVGSKVLEGVSQGVNEMGEFLMESDGLIHSFSGGEVTVRQGL